MITNNKKQGLVKFVILIIIAIIALSYFGFDIKSIVESDTAQKNLGYVWDFVKNIWETYLKGPVLYLWNDVFIKLIWSSFTENMEKIKSNEPTDFQNLSPIPAVPGVNTDGGQ